MSLTPQILWAQRKGELFITLDIQDNKDASWKLGNNDDGSGQFYFSCTAGENNSKFEVSIKLYAEINSEGAKISNTPRNVFFLIPKKESGDHWPRLLKEAKKEPHIKVDWNHYLDQDDEEAGAGDIDFSNFDFNNYGGMDGMDDADSDDEPAEDVNMTEAKPES
eukprot:TRINITY_DN2667_c0_g1_i1.p2 TRINITY_DN2667_c0_g1~~TRINITY_DN2667_c0_g1_i1.p2  ORF type:complete len:164 (-),score=31.56 TRINITY_DN2667_c0_g1_i1:383-874(-)